jgi:hypothetical protein
VVSHWRRGSHGGMGAAARWRDAGDGGCLASDEGRGRGRDCGPLGPSGPGDRVGWGGGVGLGWPAGKDRKVAGPVEEGRARGGRVERVGQTDWPKRAKWEKVFGSDFKWALVQ